MKVRSALVVAAISTVVSAFELSFKSDNPTQCFVLSVPNSTVVIQGAAFNLEPGDEPIYKDFSRFSKVLEIELLAYRKKDILEDYRFAGEYSDLTICVPEAVELGYCQEEDLGMMLYKAKKENYKPVHHQVFYPLQTLGTEFSVENPGYYCLKTYSRTGKRYTIHLAIKDNRRMAEEIENHFILMVSKAVACLCSSVLLITAWYGLQKPYTVKWLILTQLLTIFTTIWRAAHLWSNKVMEDNPFVLKFVRESGSLWTGFFMFYQLSKEFTHNRIEKPDSMKLFVIFQLTLIAEFSVPVLIHYTGNRRSLGHYITMTGARIFDIIVPSIRTGIKAYLYYRMYKRYSAASRVYTEFNKGNHPLLKQFRVLFRFHYINVGEFGMWTLVFILVALHRHVLSYWTFYREHFLVDGEHTHDVSSSLVISTALISSAELYILWAYWRPQYFNRIEEYKERYD